MENAIKFIYTNPKIFGPFKKLQKNGNRQNYKLFAISGCYYLYFTHDNFTVFKLIKTKPVTTNATK